MLLNPSGATPRIPGIPWIDDYTFKMNPGGTVLNNVAMPFTRKPRAGSWLFLVYSRSATTLPPDTTNAPTTTTGVYVPMHAFYYRTGSIGAGATLRNRKLVASDETDGGLLLPTLVDNQNVSIFILYNCNSYSISITESLDTPATTGMNRSPDNLQNSIPMVEMTAPANKGALFVTVVFNQKGGRVANAPVGTTKLLDAMAGGNAGNFNTHIAYKALAPGEASGVNPWIYDGLADLGMTTFSYLFME